MAESNPNLRQQAEQFFQSGFCELAAAFNIAEARSWRFDEDVAGRAERLLSELFQLFHDSEIAEAPGEWLRTLKAKRHDGRLLLNLDTPEDRAYVVFRYALTAKAKDGSFVGRRARGKRGRP